MPAVAAVGIEHHRRIVVQSGGAAFEERADDRHAVFLRGGGQGLAGRAGNRLGLVEASVIFALARIKSVKQLLQANDVRPGGRRFGDSIEGLLQVLLFRRRTAHLHQADADAPGVRVRRRWISWLGIAESGVNRTNRSW